MANSSQTVHDLLMEINANNPSNNSDFIVATKGGMVIPAGSSPTNLDGSESAGRAGLSSIINNNMETPVTLKQDPALINELATPARHVLDANTKAKYQQILLYFELDGYRFYLNDPFPAKYVGSSGSKFYVNPAAIICSKWSM